MEPPAAGARADLPAQPVTCPRCGADLGTVDDAGLLAGNVRLGQPTDLECGRCGRRLLWRGPGHRGLGWIALGVATFGVLPLVLAAACVAVFGAAMPLGGGPFVRWCWLIAAALEVLALCYAVAGRGTRPAYWALAVAGLALGMSVRLALALPFG